MNRIHFNDNCEDLILVWYSIVTRFHTKLLGNIQEREKKVDINHLKRLKWAVTHVSGVTYWQQNISPCTRTNISLINNVLTWRKGSIGNFSGPYNSDDVNIKKINGYMITSYKIRYTRLYYISRHRTVAGADY